MNYFVINILGKAPNRNGVLVTEKTYMNIEESDFKKIIENKGKIFNPIVDRNSNFTNPLIFAIEDSAFFSNFSRTFENLIEDPKVFNIEIPSEIKRESPFAHIWYLQYCFLPRIFLCYECSTLSEEQLQLMDKKYWGDFSKIKDFVGSFEGDDDEGIISENR